jgi:hypothetical protein
MNKLLNLRITMLKLSKIYNLDGSNKEKIEKNKNKNKERDVKQWKSNIGLKKETGKLEKGSYKEKSKSKKEKKVS